MFLISFILTAVSPPYFLIPFDSFGSLCFCTKDADTVTIPFENVLRFSSFTSFQQAVWNVMSKRSTRH